MVDSGEFERGLPVESGDFLYVVGELLVGTLLGPHISKDPRRSSSQISEVLLKFGRLIAFRIEELNLSDRYGRLSVETRLKKWRRTASAATLELSLSADNSVNGGSTDLSLLERALHREHFFRDTLFAKGIMIGIAKEADFWLIDKRGFWKKRRVPAPHTICYSSRVTGHAQFKQHKHLQRVEVFHRFEFRLNDLDNILGAVRRVNMSSALLDT